MHQSSSPGSRISDTLTMAAQFILLPDSDYNVDTYSNVRKCGPVLLMCSVGKVGET